MAYGPATKLGIDSSNPVTKRFDFQNCGVGLREIFKDTNGLRGVLDHDISRNMQGNRYCDGPISLQPNAVEWFNLLPWIFGASATGPVSGVYTFPLAESRASRFVTVDRGDVVLTYSGMAVDTATFSATEGEPLSLDLDVVGQDETVAGSGTFPAISIDTANGPFMFAGLVISFGGVTYSLKDFNLSVNFAIDRSRFLNSQTLTAANNTDRIVTFHTSMPESLASALYNTGPGGAHVVATFTNGGAVLVFDLVKFAFPRMTPMSQGRGEVMLPITGQAFKSGSTASIVVTLNQGP